MTVARGELGHVAINGIQMWRQQDTAAQCAPGREAGDHVGAPGQHSLELNVQTGPRRSHRQKFCHALFAGIRVLRRQKGRVNTG